jgi:hypothetical protein
VLRQVDKLTLQKTGEVSLDHSDKAIWRSDLFGKLDLVHVAQDDTKHMAFL